MVKIKRIARLGTIHVFYFDKGFLGDDKYINFSGKLDMLGSDSIWLNS